MFNFIGILCDIMCIVICSFGWEVSYDEESIYNYFYVGNWFTSCIM